ncbi:MAG: DUF2292 domain-containing protein [Candidatus Peribacteraceae bacterium]|nr:DUF2292 domain-containing protein [Candidatus Peribacteraceae bacterium]
MHPNEKRLLEYLRTIGYGEVTVKVHDGVPVVVVESQKKISLTE